MTIVGIVKNVQNSVEDIPPKQNPTVADGEALEGPQVHFVIGGGCQISLKLSRRLPVLERCCALITDFPVAPKGTESLLCCLQPVLILLLCIYHLQPFFPAVFLLPGQSQSLLAKLFICEKKIIPQQMLNMELFSSVIKIWQIIGQEDQILAMYRWYSQVHEISALEFDFGGKAAGLKHCSC